MDDRRFGVERGRRGSPRWSRELLGLPEHARFSFDDEGLLRRAVEDPVGFVDALPRPAAVDEFQRAGRGFLLAVKQAADLDAMQAN